MKTYIYKLSFILLSTFFMWSCNDFLTTVPESSYSVEGAYKTQSDFVFAIAGVYDEQQELYKTNTCWFRLMISRSDDTRHGAGYTYGLDEFTDGDNVSGLASGWQSLWSMISRCNLILDKIEGVEFTDSNLKSNIAGEAYVLRAWAYYTLAWQFGGMPLIDKEMSVAEIKMIPRSTQEQTFAFAEADFKKAIELLPASWSGSNLGRVTKYAAEGMLARLLMFQSKFSTAKPYLEDIINSGLYQMESNYINCFTESHDNGKERVWEIQFNGGLSGEGQSFSTGMLPEGYTDAKLIPFPGSAGAMYVAMDMASAYEPGDLRKDISIVTNIKVSGVLQSKYYYIIKYCHYDKYTPQAKDDWANNVPILRYTDVKMMYAECLNEEAFVADGEAFNIINAVRARAGLSPLTSTTVSNKDAFRTALIKERKVEFAFEGLRWNDLVRWGIAQVVINNHFMTADEGSGLYFMDGDYRKIFAIPFDELSRYNDETVMWQNSGYSGATN